MQILLNSQPMSGPKLCLWGLSRCLIYFLLLNVFGLLFHLPMAAAQQRLIALDKLQSGLAFTGPEILDLQGDDFANPGLPYMDKGAKLWNQVSGKNDKSCQSCHGELKSMKGAATRYPAIDKASGHLFNLEDRIRHCRQKRQKAAEWPLESEELLSITLYVTSASNGMPIKVSIDGKAQSHFEAGQKIFTTRQGQMNLACTQCHDQRYGIKLFTDKLSQGQPNAYPAYRIEWQRLASLERRLRFCYTGVKAEIPAWGHEDMRDISLYLMWRAQGLKIEVPSVRK
jgi:sulfur-oxidizing protein SoxA